MMNGKVLRLNKIKIDQQVHTNMENKVYKFEDLQFKPHKMKLSAVQAIMEFDNGHRISVVGGGQGLYGDGVHTFEIWRSCDDDVKGWLSSEEVTEQMVSLQELPKGSERNEFGY